MALLLAGGLAACCFSCRSRGAATHLPGTVLEVSDSSILSLRRDTFDLGRLREGERIVKEFSVKNSGNVPFVVSSAESDCGCIVSEYDGPLRLVSMRRSVYRSIRAATGDTC